VLEYDLRVPALADDLPDASAEGLGLGKPRVVRVLVAAGTTGYAAQADLRYLWMHQKRSQGSHFANDVQSAEYNELVIRKEVDPCHSETFSFDDIPKAHQLMYENKRKPGNMSCLVNAKE
jgi:crotonyl-CoA carboxylase/reductase